MRPNAAPIRQAAAGLFLALSAASAQASNAVRGAAEPVGAANALQVILALSLVIGLIVGAAWLLKRLGRFSPVSSANVRVVSALSLGARERVVLVEVGQTQLLLGVSPGRIQTLHVLDYPLPENNDSSFASRLKQAAEKEGAK